MERKFIHQIIPNPDYQDLKRFGTCEGCYEMIDRSERVSDKEKDDITNC